MNPVVVLLGMIGGLTLIGPVGLVVGPLILEYALIFIELYRAGKS
jgi:predicted PurR-regulated permease PerM